MGPRESYRTRSGVPQMIVILTAVLAFGRPALGGGKTVPAQSGKAVPDLEIRLTDDSVIKIQLRDERLELETPHGTLHIRVSEIQRIDFGLRIPSAARKRIDGAVADLGSADFRRRQAASAELLGFREKAYIALQQAAKSKDAEVARRAEQILDKLREAVPAEVLDTPAYDVVFTANSKIAGRITAESVHVSTLAFGEQHISLAHVRAIRSGSATEPSERAGDVIADPGTLAFFQAQIGKKLAVRVTAPQGGAVMGVFGTDVYTMDSSLAGAALHAGVLRPGQTGIVRVTILGPQVGFQGSMRNGVVSQPYGPWPGFRIEQPKRNKRGNQ